MSDLAIVVEERVVTFAALGVQLWDPLGERPVGDLDVVARRPQGRRVTKAFVTPSSAYAFRGLDGMAHVELEAGPDAVAEAAVPSAPRQEFAVSAVDRRGRFLPMVFTVGVPQAGLVTSGEALAVSTPNDAPIHLFSAPGRVLPANVASVRAQLAGTVGTPLAHAVVEVMAAGQRWVGVSDRRGAVVVPFPWPVFGGGLSASPAAGTAGTPPADQAWPVTVTVRSDVGSLEMVAGLPAPPPDEWPTLASLFHQTPKPIVTSVAPAAMAASITRQLQFRRDLVVSTAGQEERLLLIDGVTP